MNRLFNCMKTWRNIKVLVELLGIAAFVLAFLLVTVYLQWKTVRADLLLQLKSELKSDQVRVLQVYWRGRDESFSERNSQRLIVDPSINDYYVTLPPLSSIDSLRIDPINSATPVTISKAELLFPRNKHIDLLTAWTPDIFLQTNQLAIQKVNNAMVMQSLGDDPFFVISFPYLKEASYSWEYLLAGGVISTILLFIILNQRLLKGGKQSATLQVKLPINSTLNVPERLLDQFTEKRKSGLYIRREERNGEIFYFIDISQIDHKDMLLITRRVKELNAEASLIFQYNRPYDV